MSGFSWIDALVLIGVALITLPSAAVLLLQSLFYLRGRGYSGGGEEEGVLRGDVTVVVPVRKEPPELLDEALGFLASTPVAGSLDVIVVSDDPPEALPGIQRILEKWRSRGLRASLIWRRSPRGFRTGALNDALRLGRGRYIYVMDVDSRIDPGFLPEAASLIDKGAVAVVARWRSRGFDNRLSEALSASMEFIVDAIYVGRASLGLPVFPVGTGTLYRRSYLLWVLGGWDEERLQDDMEIGARIMRLGGRIVFLNHRVVRLDVPRRLRSLRVQQERWAYGATDVALARFTHIAGSPQPLYAKIEALAFLLQYVPVLTTLIGFLLAIPLSIVLATDPFRVYWYLGLPWIIAAGLYVYAFTDSLERRGWDRWRALVNLGRVSAATTSLSPTVSWAVVRALARRPFIYKRTPKGRYEGGGGRGWRTPWELIMGLAAAVSAALLVAAGGLYTGLWSLFYSLGYLYSFARWGDDILYG